jgi:hypothetical protein
MNDETKVRHTDWLEECRNHFNQPVLDGLDVVRLVGYEETGIDSYYIVKSAKKGQYSASAVGWFMPLEFLKEQGKVTSLEGEEWNNFVRLDNWLELNGAPKVEEFIVKINHEDMEYHGMTDTEYNGMTDRVKSET